MDVFLASRVHQSAAKHLSSLQTVHLNLNSDNHTNMDDLQEDEEARAYFLRLSGTDNHMKMDDLHGDDEARAYFPCPFCYIEIELRVLCSHLQEEHCFGLNNAVCPLCAANLGKDALGHFTVQHSHSVKRKRRSQKTGFWSNCPTMVGKDFRELSSFLGSSSISGKNDELDPVPDPLLSPFLRNMPLLDHKADQEDKISSTTTSLVPNVTSETPAKTDDFSEQDYEERVHRAAFAQELILSVIF